MKRKDLFYCIKQVLSLQGKLKCTVFCTEYKQYRVEEGPELVGVDLPGGCRLKVGGALTGLHQLT